MGTSKALRMQAISHPFSNSAKSISAAKITWGENVGYNNKLITSGQYPPIRIPRNARYSRKIPTLAQPIDVGRVLIKNCQNGNWNFTDQFPTLPCAWARLILASHFTLL